MIDVARRGSTTLKPRARIIKLLGEELITDEVIAIVELVKNSYDADATKVEVILENVTNLEDARIVIRDNGVGMSLDTVLNAWLQPGTETKKKSRERKERSKIFNRPILGEKGVGRFAAQKLGSMISLTTRSENEALETIVEIDWKMFEKDKFLSDIRVNWIQTEPQVFRKRTGALVEINFLRKEWPRSLVANLAQKLASLQSPFKGKDNFQIVLRSNDYPDASKEAQFPVELLNKSVYSFSGTVSKEGTLTGRYVFSNPAFRKLSRDLPIKSKDVRDPDYFKEGEYMRKPLCGGFSFEFYVWDLDWSTLKETITKKIYDRFIKPRTGVRIYRDNFRVWPYGKEGEDWLELDLRRVNAPPKCLSNNQIVGIVDVDHINNPDLSDKTDREGLIDNIQFRDFKRLVLLTINEFEVLRRQDKDKIDRIRERKIGKKIDEILDELEKMRRKIGKNDHGDLYSKNLDSIERAYSNYKTDIVEKLYVAAGIGIAVLMPAHEVQIQLKDLIPSLEDIKSDMVRFGLGGRIVERFDKIDRIISILWDVSDGALELTKRARRRFSLKSAVDFSLKIKEHELKRNAIDVEVVEKERIEIKGYQNLVMTALLNLVDNSIWWLQKNAGHKRLKITIKRDADNNPTIIVSDNGPGIEPADLPYLGEAFYTRKPRGTGLGLFIAKRAMEANRGKIDFGFHPNDLDYLQGANVLLIFEMEGEKAK